ncbi:hypothetical protein B0H34DRAFT_723056 [Crassisporium funariophilum]|nr:hypothetical protein B0H34DRAFT_723056 [Crassisporium funariophilum]
MRFSTVAITLLGAAASASASSLLAVRQNVPTCATACLTSADLGGCQQSDTKCLCSNKAFVSSTTTCITTACTNAADLQAALGFAQQLCAAVGVTLTGPTPSPTATPSQTSPAGSTQTSPPASTSTGAASSHGVNALVGMAAVGLVALAL